VADSALILGVTGIVVSGIIGPGIAAMLSQRSQTSGFNRSQAAGRRDELRAVLDDAAVLLATGATNLRMLQSTSPDPADLKAAKEWMAQIFPIGQRLQLWLPHDDLVVIAYETVREQLVVAGGPGTAQQTEDALQKFESERRTFLDLARAKLLLPILDKEGAE
jgi:hypothetical protein